MLKVLVVVALDCDEDGFEDAFTAFQEEVEAGGFAASVEQARVSDLEEFAPDAAALGPGGIDNYLQALPVED